MCRVGLVARYAFLPSRVAVIFFQVNEPVRLGESATHL